MPQWHGHILVDGRRTDIPSFRVKPGSQIAFVKKERPITDARFEIPEWLKVDRDERRVDVSGLPDGTQTLFPLDMKLVIEHYSKRL